MKISAIINYCTYDQKFINGVINSVRHVCSEIIVTYCDRFYDGTEENHDLINSTIKSNSDVKFVKMTYSELKSMAEIDPTDRCNEFKFCSYSRFLGRMNASYDSDYMMFMDSDEILDPDEFLKFTMSDKFSYGDNYHLESYWYFRDTIYQSIQREPSVVLSYKPTFDVYALDSDRYSLLKCGVNKNHVMNSFHGPPMVHHFSWARTKDEILKKVSTWGHKYDRDWKSLIENEFSHDFNGTDFVHGYSYNILPRSII